jgi:glycosidase
MRGIPQIYSGDEIGIPGGGDPDNRRDFPGGFPGDSHDGFQMSGRTADEQDLFAHVQKLLRLRREHPALEVGKHIHIAWDESYYAFARETPQERILVVFNAGPSARELRVPVQDTPLERAQQLEPLFGSIEAKIEEHEVRVNIPRMSVAIFREVGAH